MSASRSFALPPLLPKPRPIALQAVRISTASTPAKQSGPKPRFAPQTADPEE